MGRNRKQYTDTFKIEVIREALKGGADRAAVAVKHNIAQSTLSEWIQLFLDGKIENEEQKARNQQIAQLKKLMNVDDFENLSDIEFWSIIIRDFDNERVREKLAVVKNHAEEVAMTNANSMNISRDYIDYSIAISREKFIRDNESDVIEATRKGIAQATAKLQPVIDEQKLMLSKRDSTIDEQKLIIDEQERLIAELKLKLSSQNSIKLQISSSKQ